MFGRERVEKRSGRSGFTVSLVTASATFGLFLALTRDGLVELGIEPEGQVAYVWNLARLCGFPFLCGA